MSDDESLEREVKATLVGMAGEPAPDRLVARVAAIPAEEPAPSAVRAGTRPPMFGLVSGFAAIAAGVVLAVAFVALRPAALPQSGQASTQPTAVLPSTGPASAQPSRDSSSAVVAPASPAVPTPVPTTLVLPPAITPVPAGAPVPVGFWPMSVTFVSSADGWVLGSAPCATGRCPAIARTVDGGKTWTSINAPNTKIADGPSVDVSGSGISGLRFTDVRDGWAFGPDLWATHDGGSTWIRVEPLAGAPVLALASARGTVHAVLYDSSGDQSFRIASAPVGSDAWAVGSLRLPIGAGPVPVMQLVLSGDRGWVVENDRVVFVGARLDGGTWRSWQPPCLDTVGPAYIAASSANDVVATCDVGAWSAPTGGHLFVSRDGGDTFTATGPRIPNELGTDVATPNTKTIVIDALKPGATGDTSESVLEASFDRGHTWAVVYNAGAYGLSDLAFTNDTQGVAIATASSGASHLLMTRDGGHTWSAITF